MTGRIFRSIMAVGLIILLLCIVLSAGVLYRYYDARLTAELAGKTEYIAAGVEKQGLAYLQALQDSEDRITLIAADGAVLFDNHADETAMENHLSREEVREALDTGVGIAQRRSSTVADKQVYYALRLTDGTVLRVSNSRHSAGALILTLLQPVLLVGAAIVVGSLLLASRLARQILRPVNQLDLDHPEQAVCYEELTPLLRRLSSQQRTIAGQMAELQRQQREFAAITENMSEGFLVLDKDACVLSYNSGALHLLGAEAPAQSRFPALTLCRGEGFRRAVSLSLAGQHCQELLQENGRFCRVMANPVHEQGQVTGAVLVIMDVTETEERETLRREFTANVSHELKTPLTSILGTSDMLRSGVVQPGDVAHFAGNIHKETSRLIDLVSDIIRLSRLEEGAEPMARQPVALQALAQSVLLRLQDKAAAAGVTLAVEGEELEISAVPRVADELLFNLCDNAVQYNRPGGAVTVSTLLREGRPTLTVRDTGIGIPPEHQSRVFERFYRVDKSHSKRGGGTGLGLSIVKHAAAACGADLRLESKVDVGTTVTVIFPAQSA